MAALLHPRRIGAAILGTGAEARHRFVNRDVVLGREQAEEVVGISGVGGVVAVGEIAGDDHGNRARGVFGVSGCVGEPRACLLYTSKLDISAHGRPRHKCD